MEEVKFGGTGFTVSRLGAGLAEIGMELSMRDADQASQVLHGALDMGINFLDTAACYGISEELIGKTVSHRRDEYMLVTKAGHTRGDGLNGADWTYGTVRDSVDRSLKRMKVDHVDLVQLHSCGIDVLEEGDAIRALQDAREAGKTKLIGYFRRQRRCSLGSRFRPIRYASDQLQLGRATCLYVRIAKENRCC